VIVVGDVVQGASAWKSLEPTQALPHLHRAA